MNTTTTIQRSPSPTPAPPPSALPGPRAERFNQMFTKALTHTIRTCSYANFSSCFPTPAQHARPILESVWRQITTMIEDKSRREFEEILGEKDVVGGLNELERLVGEARGRKKNGGGDSMAEPPHTLPPQQLYLAHLAPYLQDTQTQLETELRRLEYENERLAKGVEGQRDEVEMLIGGLEAVIADLESANGVMSEAVEGEDVRREARELDREVGERGRGSRL